VRRLKRKRLSRVAVASHLVRSNQEWALDFACDTLATGRSIRVLAVVDALVRGDLEILSYDWLKESRHVTSTAEQSQVEKRDDKAFKCRQEGEANLRAATEVNASTASLTPPVITPIQLELFAGEPVPQRRSLTRFGVQRELIRIAGTVYGAAARRDRSFS